VSSFIVRLRTADAGTIAPMIQFKASEPTL
jgi:hypothetical protein